jgi:hypothetical protein
MTPVINLVKELKELKELYVYIRESSMWLSNKERLLLLDLINYELELVETSIKNALSGYNND